MVLKCASNDRTYITPHVSLAAAACRSLCAHVPKNAKLRAWDSWRPRKWKSSINILLKFHDVDWCFSLPTRGNEISQFQVNFWMLSFKTHPVAWRTSTDFLGYFRDLRRWMFPKTDNFGTHIIYICLWLVTYWNWDRETTSSS